MLPGLLPADWSRRTGRPGAGARSASAGSASPRPSRRSRACDRPPAWWARLYAALDGADREELAALPVPLADGRTAHGPAGVLLPDAGLPVDRLAPLGLRLAEPEAVGPPAARRLLERLGARPATAAAVLADPAVRAAVEASMDAVDDAFDDGPDPEDLAGGGPRPRRGGPAGGRASCRGSAELALPDADGGWAPAGELVLPGSPLAAVLEPGRARDAGPDVAATADPEALRAVGVLDTFALVAPRPRRAGRRRRRRLDRRRPRPAAARRPAAGLAAADRGA